MKKKVFYFLMAISFTCITIFLSFAFSEQKVAASDSRSFVYVITNPTGPNAVAAYKRDSVTGQLSFQASYPTNGLGNKLTLALSQSSLVTNGNHLYAVNPGSNDISVFDIEQDGSLELVGSPVPSGGLAPVSLALHNNLLYVANLGNSTNSANYTGFLVNNNGSLQPITGSTVQLNRRDSPGQVLFNSTGNLLIGNRVSGGIIDVFRVNANGLLSRTAQLANQPGPFGATFNPVASQQLFVSLAGLPGSASYLINNQGAISTISQVRDLPAKDPCWTVIRNDGTYAWTSNFLASTLSLYSINSNGSLTLVSEHSTKDFGRTSSDIAIDKNGKYMYQLLGQSARIHILQLTNSTANGGLADISTIDLPAGSTPIGLVIVDL